MLHEMLKRVKNVFGGNGKAVESNGSQRLIVGKTGEDRVAKLLIKKGYRIMDRNWRCPIGEIDVTAVRGEVIVIGEVRTRTGKNFGLPEESVGPRKQRKLVSLAKFYLQSKGFFGFQPRFDVFSLQLDEQGRIQRMEHIEDAFRPKGFQM
jgi:putative endonuclease